MSVRIYEDGLIDAILQDKAVTEGHVVLYVKKQVKHIEQLSDGEISHLFSVSNIVSSTVFEATGAQGTNIIVNNGINGISVNIVPRKEGDNINVNWELKPAKPEDLEKLQKKIREHTDYIGLKFGKKPSNDPKLRSESPEKEIINVPNVSHSSNTIPSQGAHPHMVPSNDTRQNEAHNEEGHNEHHESSSKKQSPRDEDDYRIRQIFRLP
jgi:diadenosine tetraphosphate (Ap4A) HIT family hydrolase